MDGLAFLEACNVCYDETAERPSKRHHCESNTSGAKGKPISDNSKALASALTTFSSKVDKIAGPYFVARLFGVRVSVLSHPHCVCVCLCDRVCVCV